MGKVRLNSKRKFNGKIFYFQARSRIPKSANEIAERFKQKGFNVRVVPGAMDKDLGRPWLYIYTRPGYTDSKTSGSFPMYTV